MALLVHILYNHRAHYYNHISLHYYLEHFLLLDHPAPRFLELIHHFQSRTFNLSLVVVAWRHTSYPVALRLNLVFLQSFTFPNCDRRPLHPQVLGSTVPQLRRHSYLARHHIHPLPRCQPLHYSSRPHPFDDVGCHSWKFHYARDLILLEDKSHLDRFQLLGHNPLYLHILHHFHFKRLTRYWLPQIAQNLTFI